MNTIMNAFDNWISKNEKRNTLIFTIISALITVFLIGNIVFLLPSFSQNMFIILLSVFFALLGLFSVFCTAAGFMASVELLSSKE